MKDYLMAGLGPSLDDPGRALDTLKDVPGLAVLAIVSSVKIDSAIPSSKISRKSTRTFSVNALVLRLHTAWSKTNAINVIRINLRFP